jgi:23S rRNA (guanosine2251-2'-O)-methyltransferase
MASRFLHGFHAILSLLRQQPGDIELIYMAASRQDARARELLALAGETGVRVMQVDRQRLDDLAHHAPHQGVVAQVRQARPALSHSLDDILDALQEPPLLLLLDGVQDPHNLGACLRVADAMGVHAVVIPKDRAVGLNATARKVASGAAETIPLITVTNLVRTINELKERNIWIIGAAGEAQQDLFSARLEGGLALVLGAEGSGLRRLTREACDHLVKIPMFGQVESLNVSVASGIFLFEARRQRAGTA